LYGEKIGLYFQALTGGYEGNFLVIKTDNCVYFAHKKNQFISLNRRQVMDQGAVFLQKYISVKKRHFYRSVFLRNIYIYIYIYIKNTQLVRGLENNANPVPTNCTCCMEDH